MKGTCDYREVFHTELKSFMKNLCNTFEDDREFMLITTSLHFALSDDPNNEVPKAFYNTVLPHKDLLERRDPSFYTLIKTDKTEYKLLSKLDEYWVTLSPEDQNTVWNYIKVIFVVSRKLQGS